MGALVAVSLVITGLVGCERAPDPAQAPQDRFQPSAITPQEGDEQADESVARDDAPADEQADAEREADAERQEIVVRADSRLDLAIERAREAIDGTDAQPRHIQPGQSRSDKRRDWKPAVLEVVTNFEKAEVTVNGMPYPAYLEDGQEPGMLLPAGGPHTVEVTYAGNTKTYTVHLRPNETRLLMVELSGFNGGNARASTRRPSPRPKPKRQEPQQDEEDEDEDKEGRVTVYSKPKGKIMVDGNENGESTPSTVNVEPGRHELQVAFDDGEISEKKIVRVREGSRIKLFFRQKD
jgi:hypothetical protein